MAGGSEWLRVRGMGRERFAGHLAEYLGTLGYRVERVDSTEESESRLSAELSKMNPAVPDAARALKFTVVPTSGGAAVLWVAPLDVPLPERSRFDRLVREIVQHLERTILTESHATAKVSRSPELSLPWETAVPGATGASGAAGPAPARR